MTHFSLTQARFYQSGLSRIPKWHRVCLELPLLCRNTRTKPSDLVLFSAAEHRNGVILRYPGERRCLFGLTRLERKHASLSQFKKVPYRPDIFGRVDKLIKNSKRDDNGPVFRRRCTIIAFHTQYLWQGVIMYLTLQEDKKKISCHCLRPEWSRANIWQRPDKSLTTPGCATDVLWEQIENQES